MYVDNERNEVADVSCSATGSSGYSCSGKLPAMSNGIHTLELVSFSASDGESARSAPMRVNVTAITVEQSAGGWSSDAVETLAEGLALRIEKLAVGIDRPVDAAFLPDGRLLIVERAAHVRVFADGALALEDSLPREVTDRPDALLSIAVDPAFDRTRGVFLVEVARAARGMVVRIARYTELRGRLGQRAIIFQAPVDNDVGAAVLRFGADGNLYLALDGETATGQLLRLTPDGRTPRDSASVLPAVAAGIIRLRGMAWAPSGLLWIAGEDANSGSMNAIAMSAPPVRARVETRQFVRDHLGPLAFYTADAIGVMRGDALVASSDGHILRVHFADREPSRIARMDRLLDDRVGPIRTVAVGADGAIYFCTDDALGRLRTNH
jgi:glucose/arabinose dehydrogenase